MTQDEKKKFSFEIEYTERQLAEPMPLAPWPYVAKEKYKWVVKRKNIIIWMMGITIIAKSGSLVYAHSEDSKRVFLEALCAGSFLFVIIANHFFGKLED